jgi:hypothetical protein
MKKYLAILSAFVVLAFCSCTKPAGNPTTGVFNIEGTYNDLEVSNSFDVYVSDTASRIYITVGENIMPKVVVKKEGSTLKIYLKSPVNFSNDDDRTVILPYCADLKDVELSGASKMYMPYTLVGEKVEVSLSGASKYFGNIEAQKTDLDISGSSDFFGNIISEQVDMDLSGSSNLDGSIGSNLLDMDLSGASDVKLIGRTSTLRVNLSGSSNILRQTIGSYYALECENCEGSLSGASNAYIHCDNSIRVSLSGASELHYTGNATTTGSTISGGSTISRDDKAN